MGTQFSAPVFRDFWQKKHMMEQISTTRNDRAGRTHTCPFSFLKSEMLMLYGGEGLVLGEGVFKTPMPVYLSTVSPRFFVPVLHRCG